MDKEMTEKLRDLRFRADMKSAGDRSETAALWKAVELLAAAMIALSEEKATG